MRLVWRRLPPWCQWCQWCCTALHRHHVLVSLAQAPTVVVPERTPADWVDDMRWHRVMYAESKFRWAPEDPVRIAMRWARGRIVFETPGQLKRLDAQLMQLREYTCQIQDAMAPRLRTARPKLGQAWLESLELIGLGDQQARFIIDTAHPVNPDKAHPEVTRALRGIPLPNPLSQVWELRQMHAMYAAAVNLLEDVACDLILELAPKHGWDYLGSLTVCRNGQQLRWRVEDQREERGEPGDPRRLPEQTY